MRCPSCQAPNPDSAGACVACGEPLYLLARGTVLARRYEIIEPLGRGGMGVVYKARDLQLDETVALKILRSDIAPQSARRFTSEIKLARRVRHRNVCGIHEYHEDGARRFIAMELIEGVDLRRILKEHGALPTQEAYDVAVQTALGLEAIHEVGIVHRDLKTSNLMRDARGVVRLMDFGIAKELGDQEATGLTAAGQIVGTPEYMSPEQAQGQQLDSRSDLYALGIVVFELFTGAVPFHGPTPVSTLFKHVREPPPLDGPRAAGIPPELLPILHKALAKEPAERFATAREMAHALEAARDRTRPEMLGSPVELVEPGAATATWPGATVVPATTVAPATAGAPAAAVTRAEVARRPGRPWWHALVILAGVLLPPGLAGYLYLRPARAPAAPPALPPLATPTTTPGTPLPAATAPTSPPRPRTDTAALRAQTEAIVFVPGTTTFQAPMSVTPRGFRDTPGVEIKAAQAPAPQAQLMIEVIPSVIRAGDACVLRYSLINLSDTPLTIDSVSLRSAPATGGRADNNVAPLSRIARPQSRTVLFESRGSWGRDRPSDWATTLTVVLDDGGVYSSTLRAERQ